MKREGAISFWCEPFELLEMEEFDDVPEVYSSFFDTINNIDCELNKILESTNYMSVKDSKILKMLCYLFNKGKKDYPYEYTLSHYLYWSIKK